MAEDQIETQEAGDILERPVLLPPATKEQREANWRSMEQFVNKLGDRLGTGIDEAVVEPVVALNLLEINTSQSCEGHLDHGAAAPWIMFRTEDTDEMIAKSEEISKLWEEEDRKRAEGAPDDEFRALHERRYALNEAIKKPNLEAVKKVMSLLGEFYADRKVPFDRQLKISVYGDGSGKLQPHGAEVQEIETSEVRTQKLAEYREEMKTFSTFLKGKYLGE